MPPQSPQRRFACTACGACCDRGPEMELSEAAPLADRFILSLLFKVQSIPLDDRSERARAWWQRSESRIPQRAALEESRRLLAAFASKRQPDRRRDRQTFVTLSAIVADDGRGRCPALADRLCAIHDRRPLTCRTVPLHYSRPGSTLHAYLDRFVATPGYGCDTGSDAPMILDGSTVIDRAIAADRDRAIALAKSERAWKAHLLAAMDDSAKARAMGLPTLDAMLAHSDGGFATSVPILAAWRIAATHGLIAPAALHRLAQSQAALIEREIAAGAEPEWLDDLGRMLPVYRAALSRSA